MSEEQLKAFVKAMKADAGLEEKMKSASDADAVVAIAKAAGFVISAEDLEKSPSLRFRNKSWRFLGGALNIAWWRTNTK